MSYTLYDSLADDDHQRRIASQKSLEGLEAAIYDVRQKYSSFLSDAADVSEFKDRVALVKDEMIKMVEGHLMPVPGVMRKVVGAMKSDWRQRNARDEQPNNISDPDGSRRRQNLRDMGYSDHPDLKGYEHENKTSRWDQGSGRGSLSDFEDWSSSVNQDPGDPYSREEYEGHNGPVRDYDKKYKRSSTRTACEVVWQEAPGEDPQHREAYPEEDVTLSVEPNGLELWDWECKDGSTTKGSGTTDTPEKAMQAAEDCYNIEIAELYKESRTAAPRSRRKPLIVDPDREYPDNYQGEGPSDPEARFWQSMEGPDYTEPPVGRVGGTGRDRYQDKSYNQSRDRGREEHERYDLDDYGTDRGPWMEDGTSSDQARSMGGRDWPHKSSNKWDEGDVINEGDWEGYLDSVDDGAPAKINHNFTNETHDPNFTSEGVDPNFVPSKLAIQDNTGVGGAAGAGMGGSDPSFSNTIGDSEMVGGGTGVTQKPLDQAWDSVNSNGGSDVTQNSFTDAAGGGLLGGDLFNQDNASGAAGGLLGGGFFNQGSIVVDAYSDWCESNNLKKSSFDSLELYRANVGRADFKMLHSAISRVHQRAAASKKRDPIEAFFLEGEQKHALQDERALLEKADQALTDLLNNRAEKFQETLGPIQQALQAVQYAETIEQQANPMNVMPPAGTVNVMPGQDPTAPNLNMPPVPQAMPGDVDPMAMGQDPMVQGDPLMQGLAMQSGQGQKSSKKARRR